MDVIDLFAGCGGLSIGFIQAGYKIKKAVEFDEMIASTYLLNHKNVELIVDDIKNIDKNDTFKKNDASIIIGGPPCQGFSMAGARIRHGFIDDPRNYLFKHYFNVVKKVQPEIFIMENVKGMKTMQGGLIFNEIINNFSDPSLISKPYNMYYKIVKAVDFGIPQKRERLIIIGSRKPIDNFDIIWEKTKKNITKKIPSYFDKVTIKDAIANLPEPTVNGEVKNPSPKTNYQKYLQTDKEMLTNHNATKHSLIATKRMHKIKNGENYTVLNEKINSVHSGAYGRLKWDDVAPTITTRFDTPAGGMFTHPTADRTLTPREAARIQSFPDNYIFTGNRTSICKQIGNAVPPKISYFLAKFISEIMKENKYE